MKNKIITEIITVQTNEKINKPFTVRQIDLIKIRFQNKNV